MPIVAVPLPKYTSNLSLQAGSLHGKFIDATPFSSSVKKEGKDSHKPDSIVNELGPMLASYGFNYHGTEVLYSGFFGTEMECAIFIGPVYYQRLRHMVSDKFQVSTLLFVLHLTCGPLINIFIHPLSISLTFLLFF